MSDIATHHGIPEVTLGWRLRIAMERADIKADDMARLLGVHRGTITRWTHDIGSAPRPIYLEKWSEVCQVPLPWLAGRLYRDPLDGALVVADVDNRLRFGILDEFVPVAA